MLIYIILLLVLVVNCCFENNKKLFNFSIFILFIVAALRSDDVDRDYKTYISIYEYLINGGSYTIEPTFILLTYISHVITGSYFFIFVIYAALALHYKSKYIRYFSPYICLSLLIYYSNFYFVHELTQIRIGVASAIGFYSLKYIIDGRKNKFIAFVLVATLFHFSMIILLVSLMFDTKRISNKFIFSSFLLIIISYSIIILNFNPLEILRYIPISVLQEKLTIYKYQTANGMVEAVNVFSALQVIHIGVLIVVFCNANKFDDNPSMVLLCKLYSLSPISLALLSSLPAFAIRISELFSVADIIVLPILALYCKQRKIARFAVVLLAVLVFFMNLYHNEIVKGYSI